MKLMAIVLSVCLLALSSVSARAQAVDQRSGEAFQVRKNVIITDMSGARFGDQKVEDLKLWEDGSEQKITALSSNRGQLHLVIVIDDSGSMASQKSHVAAVGKFIVENLEPNAQVKIIRFPSPERIRVVNEWTSDKSALLQLFDDAPSAGGGSPIYDGVWAAIDQTKDEYIARDEKRFAVVLISDCMEGGSLHKREELLDELKKTNVPLFTVMLMQQHDRFLNSPQNPRMEGLLKPFERFAHDSALASGGSAYFPRKGDNAKLPLAETLKDLTAELWSQFIVTYTPTNQTRDGKERKVRIEVADTLDKRVVRMKETYVGAQSR